MIDIKYFSSKFPDLPSRFLEELDNNLRRLSGAVGCHIELVNATSAAVTYQLPDGNEAQIEHHVVKVDSSGNAVTIRPATGQTILNSSTKVLGARYDSVRLVFSKTTQDWVTL